MRCVTFSPDSSTLISGGDNGELFHWDLRTRRCRHRHADAGMSPLTCLDYSDTGQYLACGSRSGVVNVYDMTQPIKGSQSCVISMFFRCLGAHDSSGPLSFLWLYHIKRHDGHVLFCLFFVDLISADPRRLYRSIH